ncbi:MAG: hypothetical protein ABIR67_12015, partial [Gaiellaceae bacterium]
FKVQATAASLVSNVTRACNERLIDGRGSCNALAATVGRAALEHTEGDHAVEQNLLAAWIDQLESLRGKRSTPRPRTASSPTRAT